MNLLGKILIWMSVSLLLCMGCEAPIQNEVQISVEDTLVIELGPDTSGNARPAEFSRYISLDDTFNALNFNELKGSFRDMTSTFLSDDFSSVYQKPDITDGYFGKYFFPNTELSKEVPMLASAVMFSNELPWYASNTSEKLIELTCYNNSYVLSELEIIGNSPDSLLNTFQNHKVISEEWHVFYDTNGLVKLIVRSPDDGNTVKSYRLGMYSDIDLHAIIESLKDTW